MDFNEAFWLVSFLANLKMVCSIYTFCFMICVGFCFMAIKDGVLDPKALSGTLKTSSCVFGVALLVAISIPPPEKMYQMLGLAYSKELSVQPSDSEEVRRIKKKNTGQY